MGKQRESLGISFSEADKRDMKSSGFNLILFEIEHVEMRRSNYKFIYDDAINAYLTGWGIWKIKTSKYFVFLF